MCDYTPIRNIIKACSTTTDSNPYVIFTEEIHKIPVPMDLWENNQDFKFALQRINIELRWGTKASHSHKHAYVIPFGHGSGEIYSIWSNVNLDLHEGGTFCWKAHDLFEK